MLPMFPQISAGQSLCLRATSGAIEALVLMANALKVAARLLNWRNTDLAQFCPEDFEEYAEIESVSEVSDGAGGYTDAWALRVGIWCMIETTSGGESVIAGRLEHSEGLTFTTHYNSEILETDRLKFENEYFKITRIENIDRKQSFIRIYAETGRT